MAKDIVINNFQKGIAPSAYLGFEEVRNLNNFDKPGIIYPGVEAFGISQNSSSIVDELIIWMKYDGTDVIGLGGGGDIYKYTDGSPFWSLEANQPGTGDSGGLEIWKNYIFQFERDVSNTRGNVNYATVADPTTWVDDWQTDLAYFTSSLLGEYYPSVKAQNDKLYIGNGRYVAELQEDTTFDPTDSGTYTWNATALTLPQDTVVTCMTELGDYLVIGTENLKDELGGNLFLWDKTSTETNIILRTGLSNIKQIVTAGNLVYFIAGDDGEMFVTNGTSIQPYIKIPKSLGNWTTNQLAFYPGAIASKGNKIYFGASSSSAIYPVGIYVVDLNTRNLSFWPLSPTDATSDTALNIGSIIPFDRDIYSAWEESGTSWGVDTNGGQATDYAGYLITQMYRVGTRLSAKTFIALELELANSFNHADESVKVEWRETQNGSWTTIDTFSGVGGSHFESPFGESLRNIQLKISFDTKTGQGYWPELLEVRLK